MTSEEHKLLIENNITLKQILAYIVSRDGPNIDFKEFAMNVVANLITNNTIDIIKYLDVDEVIANKLINNTPNSSNITELLNNCKSKDITYTRLSRALLHVILKLETQDLNSYIKNDVYYVRILGFKNTSSDLIKTIKKKSSITLINKLSLGQKSLSGTELKMLNYDIQCANLYNKIVSLKYNTTINNEYKRGMIII